MRRAKKHHPQNNLKNPTPKAVPFLEHIYELRRRCLIIAAAIAAGGSLTYLFHKQITVLLLMPAQGEHFIYTTPGGGIDFLFRLCLYCGIIVGIPTIIFQFVQFLTPLFEGDFPRLALVFSGWSAVAAAIGVFFGYTFGLPSALQFLIQDMSSQQISATITIQSYLSFVLGYLAGAALLLQLPLVLLFINRIRPLQPRKLLGYERWVIIGSFIIGAILNPTPSVIDFLSFSLPLIITYQIGVIAVWIVNSRHSRPLPHDTNLSEKDAATQDRRRAIASQSISLFGEVTPHSYTAKRTFQVQVIDRRGNLA